MKNIYEVCCDAVHKSELKNENEVIIEESCGIYADAASKIILSKKFRSNGEWDCLFESCYNNDDYLKVSID